MDALELLLNRVSCPVLEGPAPNPEQLDLIYRAALRAPDHGGLKPYRFLQIEDSGRERLGALFIEAARIENPNATQAELNKLGQNPLRAPMIIVAIASLSEHPKVPKSEQRLTAGCAAHGLLLAAYAQGLDAIWRSGPMAFNPQVMQGLGLDAHEEIIGFIYLGQSKKRRLASCPAVGEFVRLWGKA
ncbi:nitroreductase family protein [Nitrincola tapanii]|uniref:Putative NAD(P)H nitroreductase n=1 Tax=Nitrincola tapanii TaxID=1708751 RepID=A0A5A9W4X5_9GAMM|nr:nitroreductase family protein [Nitrincola tapanii]KAA0875692.1 nitroreductase [Nitrincola tapanii]